MKAYGLHMSVFACFCTNKAWHYSFFFCCRAAEDDSDWKWRNSFQRERQKDSQTSDDLFQFAAPSFKSPFPANTVPRATRTRRTGCFSWTDTNTGQNLVPKQKVKVQEAVEARWQSPRTGPYACINRSIPAFTHNSSYMGRFSVHQRSKHAGQQLYAWLLSLVLVPTPRVNAEIDWQGEKGRRAG